MVEAVMNEKPDLEALQRQLANAHNELDELCVPRATEDGLTLTISGRLRLMREFSREKVYA